MGTKRVTSLDVARRASVSRTTVSFVLNKVEGMQISEETRKRVLDAARDLGYVPDAAAKALASGRSQTIGLLLTRRQQVIASDMYLIQVIEVLVREVKHQGMRLLLEVLEDFGDEDSYLKLVRSKSIDGILYSGPRFNDDALRLLVEHGVPTVLMGAVPGSNYAYVDVDNHSAARLAVDYLLRLGHSRIGCITNASPSYVAAADRLQGYQAAMSSAGLPLDMGLVRYGDFDSESGYIQMNSLLDANPHLTAAFVASDVVAFGAMAAVREHGLHIPQDISLVGFDNVPFSRYIDPGLTTIQLPVVELARRASEMVVGMIHGELPAHPQVLLDASLTVRNSCCAVKER